MSILIRGMEMPKAGNWKTIRIYYDGTCAEPNWQGDCKYMRGCEAVPVPPHGRLIDSDALRVYMLNAHYNYREVVSYSEIIEALTIIPADHADKEAGE